MLDAQLIAACVASRKAYDRVAPHITEDDLGPYAKFWWTQIKELYNAGSGDSRLDLQVLVEYGRLRIRNPKHEEVLLEFARDLPEPDSPDSVSMVALELKRHNAGLELAQAISQQDYKAVERLLPAFEKLMQATDLAPARERQDAEDWNALHNLVDSKHRIPVAPGRLNERLRGGVWRGSHIIIVGRTDMGKTTLAINMARGFLWHGERVLYAGTEDNINALKYRMMGSLANMTPQEIEANPDKAEAKARELAEDRLLMTHLHRPDKKALEEVIEEFEPTVLVLDQIRSYAARAEGMTQRLEEAGIEVREILSRHELIGVSVTQANDRTQKYGEDPPPEIGISDIDSSRTGLPGTGDLIVGLGADAAMLARGQRLLTPAKNKFSSDKNAKQPLVVDFDTARSRVK